LPQKCKNAKTQMEDKVDIVVSFNNAIDVSMREQTGRKNEKALQCENVTMQKSKNAKQCKNVSVIMLQ
jgi:hypothetical protein